eukprot:GGOE01018463.1.p1 GENE.GGOE01018463.1~~GGOE01018463.1.p1  ORF type:complete len:1192 (+),score=305.51 GGOE01018463.1:54-3578(+)
MVNPVSVVASNITGSKVWISAAIAVVAILIFYIVLRKAVQLFTLALLRGAPLPKKVTRPRQNEKEIPPALAHRVTNIRGVTGRTSLKPDPCKKKEAVFPSGFPMMSPFGGFDLSQAAQNPFLMGKPEGQPKEPVEKGVAVLVGVMEIHRGRADLRISTAVRDVREMADAFQTFDFDTYSIHDQREELEARPTARMVLSMLRQVKQDKVANTLVIYLACHARVSDFDSQVEFLLQQPPRTAMVPPQEGSADEWLPLSALADFAFDVNVTTYFLLNPVLLQGVDTVGFLKRVKAAVKHQPHTHVLVACTQPLLCPDETCGLFAQQFRKAVQEPYFKHRDVTLPAVRHILQPTLMEASSLRDPILLWNNELGHASLNHTVGASKTKGTPYLASLLPFCVPRPEMSAVKDALLKRDGGADNCPLYVVTGPPSSGKTQAVLQLASDVQESFNDGVFLITPARHDHAASDLLRILAQVSLGFDGYFHNEKEAKEFFRQHMTGALLIVEDVRDASEIEPFQAVLASSNKHAIVAVTHDEALIRQAKVAVSLPQALDTPQSTTLLAWATSPTNGFVDPVSDPAKAAVVNLAAAATDVATLLEGDAQALAIVAGCVALKASKSHADPDWGEPLKTLEAMTGGPVERAVALALDGLPPLQKEMMLNLAVFPAKVPVSLDAMLTLWRPKHPELPALKAASIIRKFCAMHVISLVKTLYGWAALISPEVSATLANHIPDMAALHNRLVHSYYVGAMGEGAKMPDNVALREWHQVANDEYFYEHIFRSWKEAGMKEVTLQMKKFEWLRAKVWGAGIHSLLQDFEEISDEQFRTLHDALKLSRGTLARACWELSSQLYGRLGTSLNNGAAVSVCAGIERRSEGLLVGDLSLENELWLRPLFHSGLQLPKDLPLHKQAAEMHTQPITCLLFFGEGLLASASEDGIVKIWDVDSGKCLASLPHPKVSTLVLNVDGCLCSGSREDRTIIKWMDWAKGEGEKQTVLEKPPKKEEEDAKVDKYTVCMVKSGLVVDDSGEPVRDAVLFCNSKDEDVDASQESYRLLYVCCDDQRVVMASWTHDCEVRQVALGEHSGFYIVAIGDVKGNVILTRVERYTPLTPPGLAGGCPVMGGGGGGGCPVMGGGGGGGCPVMGGGGGGGCPVMGGGGGGGGTCPVMGVSAGSGGVCPFSSGR